MSVRFTTLLAVSALTLGGCAATVDRKAPSNDAGAATQQQTSMKIPAEAGKRLVLNMQLDPKLAATDTGWAGFKKEGQRIAFGVFSGNAYIDSKVEFRDLATGKLYGERAYNTSSSAWGGVFSAMTPKQIYALADEIIAEIKQP